MKQMLSRGNRINNTVKNIKKQGEVITGKCVLAFYVHIFYT